MSARRHSAWTASGNRPMASASSDRDARPGVDDLLVRARDVPAANDTRPPLRRTEVLALQILDESDLRKLVVRNVHLEHGISVSRVEMRRTGARPNDGVS